MLQPEALDILKMGKNVFLSGPAGSGKTHVLNEYVKYLKSHAVDVAVTASTGIAATHLGGQTIHSWSGLGVRDTLSNRDIDDMMQKQYLYKRFDRTKVLIIDEVSMLHHFRLDLIEWICRQMKHNERPFGGMQVVLSGDFFQLPPVTRNEIIESEFAYKGNSWQDAGLTICYLSEQHRQKDNAYLSILNQIRQNSVSQKTIELLKTRLHKDSEDEGQTTKLYTHNIDVDIINDRHLGLIKEKEKSYEMTWRGSPALAKALKKSCLSPEKLKLKKGAKVMFTKNDIDGGYVNGTLGVISDFNKFGDPIVRTGSGMTFHVLPQSWRIEEEGKVKAEIKQLPLRLAWAITVHKSQGMSLDAMEVDLSKSFVRGMGYVALSRVRSLEGMKLLGFNDMSLEVDPEVLSRDREFRDMSDDAVADLKEMFREEIIEAQKVWMKKIEPEEKIKIKKKEKEENQITKKSTQEITAGMLKQEASLEDITKARALKQETIVSHIEDLMAEKNCPDITYLKRELKRSELDDILSAFKKTGATTLSPVYNLLTTQKKKPSYLKIRLARLFLEK
ncbi:MAG: AAA family ATPase [Candidatus Zambryskibacteria bacterium]|nr:AAA family ATPase [Candidatus Zambryskibacteria bacterium]